MNKPEDIYNYISNLPGRGKIYSQSSYHTKDILYKDSIITAINSSFNDIRTFYIKYNKTLNKIKHSLPTPTNLRIPLYDKLNNIIIHCERYSKNKMYLDLAKLMCFQTMSFLLYEDYFNINFSYANHNFEEVINNIVIPETEIDFYNFVANFVNGDPIKGLLLFSKNSEPILVTMTLFIQGKK
jgi:hypothetical protein